MGIGVALGGSKEKLFNIEVAIEKMLEAAKTHNKKILVTIDEAAPGKDMHLLFRPWGGYFLTGDMIYLLKI